MESNDEQNKARSKRSKEKRRFFWRRRKRASVEDVQIEREPITNEDGTEKRPRKSWLRRLTISTIVTSFILFVIFIIGYTVILYGGSLLVKEEKLVITPPTTIETADGEIIWYLFDEFRLPVNLEQIPEHVQDAFIVVEDRRFYEHVGIDFKSIIRAVYKDIVAGGKVEGASTITQQLAKNLFLTNEKSWLRKTQEIMISLHMEREFTKEEILEMYLNVIYFGHGQYGLEAAANKYFNKSVEELTVEEGAMLAGMIKAPNTNSPINAPERAKERRDLVLDLMYGAGLLEKDEVAISMEQPIELNVSSYVFDPVYHTFVEYVISEAEKQYGLTMEELRKNRYRIISTMNKDFQTIAYEEFEFDGYFPGNNDEVEGAFVMMDQEKGELLALIGGRDYEVGNLNRVRAMYQPGSIFKPLAVFAPALMTGDYQAYSVLPDELMEWNGHEVKNADNKYDGEVTFYDALRYSKNTSSTWLLNEIGVNYAKEYLEAMGIEIEDTGLAIALGGLKYGVTPVQMVEAYRVFNHRGQKIDAHAIKTINNYKGEVIGEAKLHEVEVFSPQVAWTMTEILRQTVETGTASTGEYNKELAGKTGTTQHAIVKGKVNDAWFAGYTPEYVTALWMGYDRASDENYLTGGSAYPTRLTKEILSKIDSISPIASTFSKPDDVEEITEPVTLPVIDLVSGEYIFGGLSLLKGKLRWTVPLDDRIVYHVYKRSKNKDVKIGEVTGEGEFIIDKISLFQTDEYFVVPVDPLSGLEGEPSEIVRLLF